MYKMFSVPDYSPTQGHRKIYAMRSGRDSSFACHILAQCGNASTVYNNHADGGLVACTPCDLTFILLPMLEKARGKNAETSGKFCSIEQILHSDKFPDLTRLTHLAGVSVETVCDHKEVEEEKYYRLNNGKVQAWLCCKVNRLQQALKTSSSGLAFQGMDELQLAAYCVAVLAEYVQEHWLTELRELYSVASQGDEIAPSQLQSSQESNPQAGGKRPRFDPKELAKKRLKEVKDEAKRISLAKEASTMRSITSFFAKPHK